jgi:hypothetical protein
MDQTVRPSVHSGGQDFTAVTIETFGAISDNFQSLVRTSSDVNESLFVTREIRSVMIHAARAMRRNGYKPSDRTDFSQAGMAKAAILPRFSGTPAFRARSPVQE